ncbi:MAG: aminoacyl-tRNA hydrolase [Candidatus Omnitrophota bacterium]|nr:aminoacyl-tRNA hydrolase [Candidatus Omnitrophota bacterium]
MMKLIIGLGNPGIRYRWTRHNMGFRVVEGLAKKHRISLTRKKFKSVFGNGFIGEEKVTIVKPLRYVNLSGREIKSFIDWLKPELNDIIVICDDLNLELGRIRIRQAGSAGGHNGLRSIIDCLGTSRFPRLRIGIARGKIRMDLSSYVLDKFKKKDKPVVKETVGRAAEAVEIAVKEGLVSAMNKFN